MSRFNLVLLIALMGSGLYLVNVSYESRRLFTALERSQGESRTLDTDRKRLEAERQAQATNLRVEKVARDRLGMRSPTPAVTEYVVDGPSAVAGVTP